MLITYLHHALQDCIGCVGRLILLFSKYSYGRDSVEPAIKPGEAALVCKLVITHTFFAL